MDEQKFEKLQQAIKSNAEKLQQLDEEERQYQQKVQEMMTQAEALGVDLNKDLSKEQLPREVVELRNQLAAELKEIQVDEGSSPPIPRAGRIMV